MSDVQNDFQTTMQESGDGSEVVPNCLAVVEEYRNGEITKPRAVYKLSNEMFDASGHLSADAIDSALSTYLEMLEEVDSDLQPDKENSRCSPASDGGEAPEAGQTKPTKSVRSRESSTSDDEPSPKRARADPSKFAWTISDFIGGVSARPELKETVRLLRKYAVDPKLTKSNLLNSFGAPEFPDSEWTNVLAGKAVDLDHVFAGRYSAGQEDKQVEKLGEFEISHRALVPAKKILSFGDWVYAWSKAIAAISYAFPHRQNELSVYGDYITGLFGALATPLHYRLLDFDRAVRKRAGSRRDLLLTDFADFADLKLQFLDSSGANVYEEKKNVSVFGAPGIKRQKDPCRRWNAGNCTTPASACRYQHVCANCGGTGHTGAQCSKNAGKPSS